MKVVLTGIYYPVAILRYFEAAALRNPDIEVIRVGPHTSKWIPWSGGMELDNLPDSIKPPDIVLPMTSGAPIRYVEGLVNTPVDLWLQIDAGFHLVGKPQHGKNFIVGTDPHVLDYTESRRFADKFFCMQTPYMQVSDIHLPYAYDPVWHSVEPETLKIRDVGLIGIPYADRVSAMRRFQNQSHSVMFTHGPCYDEARHLYNECRIGFNWSSLKDLTARVFEVMAMGLCPIVNRVPDLITMGFIEGRDYLGFDSLDEAVAKVSQALSTSTVEGTALWQAVAQNARAIVEQHAWDARIKEILSYV